jgi:pimeloyl-ACP methyl ester carboxylesterase
LLGIPVTWWYSSICFSYSQNGKQVTTIEVNGGAVAYEIFGAGPLFTWNAGGREAGVSKECALEKHLASRYTVLLWDRRNSAGASDIYLSEVDNPVQADADDLHAIIEQLNLGPGCIAGGSAGCALSLLMAHRYPQDVTSILAMKPASMDEDIMGFLAEITWYGLAEKAESDGMQAVLDLSEASYSKVVDGSAGQGESTTAWIAKSIAANPMNRDRLLAMNPERFAAMFRNWGDHTKHGGAMAGLTEDEIQSISVPAYISAGDDPIHPRESGIWLDQQLPNSEMSNISQEGLTTAEGWWAKLLPEIDDFLTRTVN